MTTVARRRASRAELTWIRASAIAGGVGGAVLAAVPAPPLVSPRLKATRICRPGNGQIVPEPGNPASGHGPGAPNIPPDQLPED